MTEILRNSNSAVGSTYTGVALGQLGYNLKDIKDESLLQNIIIDYMTLNDRNRFSLAKMLLYLSNKGTGVEGARVFWTAGDENLSTTTVVAAFNTATSTHCKLGLTNLQPGNRLYLTFTTGSTVYHQVEIKITGAYNTSLGYPFSVVSYWESSTGTSATVPTTAQVTVMTNTQKLDDKSPAPSTRFPTLIGNYFERVRESAVIGTHTMADKTILTDRSIAYQMKVKYYELIERLNYALYFKKDPIDPATSADNTGEFGGFNYFFKPYDNTASILGMNGVATGMKGVNTVLTGASLSRTAIEDALIPYMNYGTDKWLFAAPAFIMKVWRALFGSDAVMNYSQFKLNRSDKIWDGIPVELGTGRLWLMPDHSLTGRKFYIEDNVTDDSYVSYNTDWGLIADMEHTDLLYSDVPEDGGIQTLAMRDVLLEGGTSNKQQEWNTQLSLKVKRPETGGFISLRGS